MKKFKITMIACCLAAISYSQTTFEPIHNPRNPIDSAKLIPVKGQFYEDKQVYISKNGKYFIIRYDTKMGNPYREYLNRKDDEK